MENNCCNKKQKEAPTKKVNNKQIKQNKWTNKWNN